MNSEISGAEVADSIRMDEIGREKVEEGYEFRLRRQRRVQHAGRYIAQHEHSDRLLRESDAPLRLLRRRFEVLRRSRLPRRQRLRRLFSPRRHHAGAHFFSFHLCIIIHSFFLKLGFTV